MLIKLMVAVTSIIASVGVWKTPILVPGVVLEHRSGPVRFDMEFLAFRHEKHDPQGLLVLNVDASHLDPNTSSDGWRYDIVVAATTFSAVHSAEHRLMCATRLSGAYGIPLSIDLPLDAVGTIVELLVTDRNRRRGEGVLPFCRTVG